MTDQANNVPATQPTIAVAASNATSIVGLILLGIAAFTMLPFLYLMLDPLWVVGIVVVAAVLLIAGICYIKIAPMPLFLLWAFLIPFSIRVPTEGFPINLAYILLYAFALKFIVANHRLRIPRAALVWLTIVLVGLGSVTTLTGLDPLNSIRKLYNLLNFALVLLFVYQQIRTKEDLLQLFNILLKAGTILALIGIAQVGLAFAFGGGLTGASRVAEINRVMTTLTEGSSVVNRVEDWSRWWRYNNWYATAFGSLRATGTAWSPMTFAQMIYITYFPALALLLSWPKRRGRLLLLSVVVIQSLALLLTFSRGAWLGVIVGGSVIGYFYLRGRIRVTKTAVKRLLMVATLGLVLLFALVPGRLLSAGVAAFQSVFSPEVNVSQFDTSNEARFSTYTMGLATFTQNPALGVGLGNYGMATGSGEGATSHNLYIDIAAELGILGLLLYLGILLSAVNNFVYVIRQTQDRHIRALAVGWVATIGSLLFYWMFTSYFFEPKINIMFWLVLGISVIVRRIERIEIARITSLEEKAV